MDQKTWLWRKKSSEKTIIAADSSDLTSKENEEVQALVADKEELEKDLKRLNNKLSSALSDCNSKDELVKKQTKVAQEAMAGWKKAEAEVLSMKHDLDEALQQRIVYEERVAHLDGALKECMQQLRFVREEQGQRIHDAVIKTSKEFEKERVSLEEQLSETSKKLAKAEIENSHLNKSIFAREKLIEDLKRQLTQAEADHNALMIRLESTEKDNASLKYEVRVLEKELEIRNEEREFNRRTADASHKQHLDSVKKIAKLESECQRLRLLVRKRLPGPAALAKMKNELSAVEEENKTLKESLNRKMNELQFSRVMLSRTASKLLQLESQIEESSKGHVTLEHPRNINLMDDFVEMEKLAVVSIEKATEISPTSLKAVNEINGMEIIPVSDHISDSDLSNSNKKTCSIEILKGNVPGWLQDVVKIVLEQNHVTHKSPDDILEDIRVALRHVNNHDLCDFGSSKGSGHTDTQIQPQSQEDSSKSIGKIIEIVERISLLAVDYNSSDPLREGDGDILSYKNLGMPMGYMVRVFQWKTSELSNVLQRFLHVCYDLLNGKTDYENFAQELTTALDWIMNHCFSLQDVSSMKDAIKKQFDWDETRSEVTTSDGHDLQKGEIYSNEKKELSNIKDKLVTAESQKEVLEGKLQSATDRIESLMNQLKESEKTVDILRLDIQSFKESNEKLEDEIRNQKLINSNLDAQHTEAELKEARDKVLALEVELENKNRTCEELEAKCLELQLQLESMSKECSNHDINEKDKPLRNDWEITAASEKLAECQETILNLGKQLKAMAAPKDASLFDNVVAAQFNTITTATTTTTMNVDPRPAPPKLMKVKTRSLLDQMLADDTKAKIPKAIDGNSNPIIIPGVIEPLEKILVLNGVKDQEDSTNSLAIVPAKKPGSGSLWRKLLGRKKKSVNMKTPSS
uniref:Filament-like plant protein 7 n=1 Tax=Cajanus cajan TaxID=3821 RepID=A0A151RQU2_CAJCA|nr:Filament-like plant protein 7 [Cajanus cajan]